MADKTINQLTEDTSPTTDDYIPTWDSGSGAAKKVLLSNLRNLMTTGVYAFSAYRNAVYTVPTTATLIPFDTKEFDIGTNFSTSTNLFTAPIAGYYVFYAVLSTSAMGAQNASIMLYKNGALAKQGIQAGWSASTAHSQPLAVLLQLAANDTVGIYSSLSAATRAATTGAANTFVGGYLYSR